MAGKKKGKGGRVLERKDKMIGEKGGGEHGRLHNDFNESALSPADTLDMTPGNR